MVCASALFIFAFTLIPIRLLRYPDRELPTKPWYAERINPFFQWRTNTDTDTFVASARPETADETATGGTDKSVPYRRPLAAAES